MSSCPRIQYVFHHKKTEMDLSLEYLRPHFGQIIGDPKYITECIGDLCRKIVPLQTRTIASIGLEELRKPTANFTLQRSLIRVAKFMLCEQCRCPKSRAEITAKSIAEKWSAEGRKYLDTTLQQARKTANCSIHDIRRPDNRNARTRYARNLGGRDGAWHSRR